MFCASNKDVMPAPGDECQICLSAWADVSFDVTAAEKETS